VSGPRRFVLVLLKSGAALGLPLDPAGPGGWQAVPIGSQDK